MSWLSNLFYKDEQQPSEASTAPKPLTTAADYCKQGKKSLDAGKYVEAMEYFQAAIEADKRFEKAYFLLASAYEKQGKKDKAKATLYALLAVEPNNEKAREGIEVLDESNVVKSKSASTGTIIFQTVSTNSNKVQNGNNGANSKDKGGNEFWGVFRIVLIIVVIVIVDIILIANDIFEIRRGGTLLFLIDLMIFVLLGKLFGLGD